MVLTLIVALMTLPITMRIMRDRNLGGANQISLGSDITVSLAMVAVTTFALMEKRLISGYLSITVLVRFPQLQTAVRDLVNQADLSGEAVSRNTTVQISVPDGGVKASSHKIIATISSDNAVNVDDDMTREIMIQCSDPSKEISVLYVGVDSEKPFSSAAPDHDRYGEFQAQFVTTDQLT